MNYTTNHRQILAKYQHLNETRKLGYIRNLDKPEYDELMGVYREAFNSDEHFDSFCGACVLDLVTRLYNKLEAEDPTGQAPEAAEETPDQKPTQKYRRHGR